MFSHFSMSMTNAFVPLVQNVNLSPSSQLLIWHKRYLPRVTQKYVSFFYGLNNMWQVLYMLCLKPNQTHLRYIFTRLVFIFFCKCKGYYQYIGAAQIILNNPNISLDYNFDIKWAHVQFCTFVSITLICTFSFIGQWYAISGLLPH